MVVGRLCCQLRAGPGSGRQEVTYGTSGSSPLHIILSLLSSQMAEVTPLTRFSYGYFRDKRGRAHRRSVWGLVLKKKLVHALEKEMATHSSVLAWRIPGTGEPGGLPSMELHRVGHE